MKKAKLDFLREHEASHKPGLDPPDFWKVLEVNHLGWPRWVTSPLCCLPFFLCKVGIAMVQAPDRTDETPPRERAQNIVHKHIPSVHAEPVPVLSSLHASVQQILEAEVLNPFSR